MTDLSSIFRSLNAYDESLLEHLVEHLRMILATSHNRVLAQLQPMFPGGVIDRAAVNYRLVRKIGDLILAAARQAGMDTAVTAFAETFDGSLVYMDQIYAKLAAGTRLPAKLSFIGEDLRLAKALKANAVASIENAIASRAAVLGQRVMFSVGGMKFSDMLQMFSDNLRVSVGQATTIAATAQSTFYRSISANQYERIDGEGVIRYRYAGPDDKLTRPFCHEQLMRKRSLTREQIGKLDNGTKLTDVFTVCGSWNCRHQWIIDVDSLAKTYGVAA